MDWKRRVREHRASEDYFKISEGSVISETGKTWGGEVLIRSSVLDSHSLRCLLGVSVRQLGYLHLELGVGVGESHWHSCKIGCDHPERGGREKDPRQSPEH